MSLVVSTPQGIIDMHDSRPASSRAIYLNVPRHSIPAPSSEADSDPLTRPVDTRPSEGVSFKYEAAYQLPSEEAGRDSTEETGLEGGEASTLHLFLAAFQNLCNSVGRFFANLWTRL